MIRIRFIATRALGSHAIGDPVTLTFSVTDLTPGRKITRDVQKSLSGRRETLLHNAVRTWSITTEPMAESTVDAVEEFLQAVENGASFDFEPWWQSGADAADADSTETRSRVSKTLHCVLASEDYSLTRLLGNGNGGQDDWYQFTFTVEETP